MRQLVATAAPIFAEHQEAANAFLQEQLDNSVADFEAAIKSRTGVAD